MSHDHSDGDDAEEERDAPPCAARMNKLRSFLYSPASSTTTAGSPVASTSRSQATPSPQSQPSSRAPSSSRTVSPLKRARSQSQDPAAASTDVKPGRYKKGKKRVYAAPEQYAHLAPIPDILREDIDILWLGINPGKMSASSQHFFASPSNRFWTYLYKSGCTPEKLKPDKDVTFPEAYNYGLTNLIPRPTTSESELAKEEYLLGVPDFLRKVIKYRPKVVATCGKTIAQGIVNAVAPQLLSATTSRGASSPFFKPAQVSMEGSANRKKPGLQMGLQRLVLCHPEGVTYLIALPSPSGLETHYQGDPAIKLFASVKQLVEQLNRPAADGRDQPCPEIDERIDADIVDWLASNGEALELTQD